MESQLRGQDWVDDVALTTFMRDGEELSGERAELQERVAAVVIPSEKGWALIRDSGRRAFSSGLRGSLADAWDPILHPRYWRFVHKLPENPQGKVTQDLLRALFQHADWGQSSIDRPEVLDEMRSREAIERACLVPSDLSCFPGHFPDRLVVPGVLQLDWGLTLAEVWMGRAPEVTQIESLKLISPLNPGAHFRIRVSQPQPTRLEIKLWQHDQVFAKARIRIVTPGEQGHRR